MGQMELLREAGIRAVSPMLELGAYEALWARRETTFHRLANRFRDRPGALPSDFVDHGEALELAKTVVAMLREADVGRFDLRVHAPIRGSRGWSKSSGRWRGRPVSSRCATRI